MHPEKDTCKQFLDTLRVKYANVFRKIYLLTINQLIKPSCIVSLECECENVVDCSTLKWILDAQVHFFEHMFLLMHEYYLQVQGGWQLVYM